MVKIIGAIFLVLAGAGIGISKARFLRYRVESLASIASSLEIMKGEICTRRTPLPELSARLAVDAPAPSNELYKNLAKGMKDIGELSLAEIWSTAVRKTSSLSLKQDEQNTLCLMGMSLGRFDVSEQEQAIDRCMESMIRLGAKARAEAETQCRVYTGLGLALGMMLAIVLI